MVKIFQHFLRQLKKFEQDDARQQRITEWNMNTYQINSRII